jgi:hypothetical protein
MQGVAPMCSGCYLRFWVTPLRVKNASGVVALTRLSAHA